MLDEKKKQRYLIKGKSLLFIAQTLCLMAIVFFAGTPVIGDKSATAKTLSTGGGKESSILMTVVPSLGAPRDTKVFEGGVRSLSSGGTYQVVTLAGSWLAMGRQYGGLLAGSLNSFYQEITADLAARGVSEATRLKEAQTFASGLSSSLLELLQGISQTSRLSYDQVLVLNSAMVQLTGAVLAGEIPAACSGIGAWGEYTLDGKLVFGRNWDISREAMQQYMKYLTVAVFNPVEGISFCNIHPMGNVYLESGMNSYGLFVELNNGEQSDTNWYQDLTDTSSFLVDVLLQSKTVEDAVAMLSAEPADLSYIIQVADSTHAVSVERPTFGCRARSGDGLIAAYNSFIPDPPFPTAWKGKIVEAPPLSQDPRYTNLMNLGNSSRFRGRLDAVQMMNLLQIDVEHGGALHDGTVLQIVAVPAERAIWIRGVEYSPFERVGLTSHFTRK